MVSPSIVMDLPNMPFSGSGESLHTDYKFTFETYLDYTARIEADVSRIPPSLAPSRSLPGPRSPTRPAAIAHSMLTSAAMPRQNPPPRGCICYSLVPAAKRHPLPTAYSSTTRRMGERTTPIVLAVRHPPLLSPAPSFFTCQTVT